MTNNICLESTTWIMQDPWIGVIPHPLPLESLIKATMTILGHNYFILENESEHFINCPASKDMNLILEYTQKQLNEKETSKTLGYKYLVPCSV